MPHSACTSIKPIIKLLTVAALKTLSGTLFQCGTIPEAETDGRTDGRDGRVRGGVTAQSTLLARPALCVAFAFRIYWTNRTASRLLGKSLIWPINFRLAVLNCLSLLPKRFESQEPEKDSYSLVYRHRLKAATNMYAVCPRKFVSVYDLLA